MKYYLAIDIGASSGRHIVGYAENGEIKTQEVYRFPNGVKQENGHLVWDTEALFESVVEGIRVALFKYPEIESLSIDTWGCDYVLFNGEKEILPCYAYRDSRTERAVQPVHEKISFEDLYARTGIQFQPFNTVYQLYEDQMTGRIQNATDFLMIPEYLIYRLTGVKKKEYTNATTTGLVNARSKAFDGEIIKQLALPARLFPSLGNPGDTVGYLKNSVSERVGGQIKVVLCASHDTASAVEGIPMEGEEIYISSGTWSLLGVKSPVAITDANSRKANYSNEGGVGYIRYLKNIMGMWVVNELKKQLCPETSFPEIVAAAEKSSYSGIVDVNAPAFLAPESMCAAFDGALGEKPQTAGDYFRAAYFSLAESYKNAIAQLESNTGVKYNSIYIVGGGAKNAFLNALTEKATGKKVVALPIEATAIGNLKIQMQAK